MKQNKLALNLVRAFNFVFAAVFFLLLIGTVVKSCCYLQGGTETYRLPAIIGFLAITAIAVGAYYLFYVRDNRELRKPTLSDKTVRNIIFVGCGVLFLLEILLGFLLRLDGSLDDLNNIEMYSQSFAHTGNFDLIQQKYSEGNPYLIRYPNNFAITLMLSGIYRLCYLAFGDTPVMVPIVINCLAINASILLTALTALKIFGKRQALLALALCILFVPYYTYAPFYYTDSLSMPFCIGSVYLVCCAFKSDSNKKAFLYFALSGVLIFLGFKMKGSVILILPCVIIYSLLKLDIKRLVCAGLALIIGCGSVGIAYTVGFNSLHIATEQQFYESQYPCTHWLMMGLKGYGGYNRADSRYTKSFCNKDEKVKGNIQEIEHRLSDYGVKGFVNHLAKKAVFTWEDGTYFICKYHSQPVERCSIHSFIQKDGKYNGVFRAYCCGFQMFMLFMIMIIGIKGVLKPKVNEALLLMGLVFAIFVFLLMWESKSRYLFNFTPIFILLTAYGLESICKGISTGRKSLILKRAYTIFRQKVRPLR